MTGTGPDHNREQRGRAVITAWVLAAVALAVFTAFLLSGILGSR